ncbi:MAG: hypothetical protein IH830_02220 [Planctomycetes bacterium]|nr:hypothetical protein [Planctomycetota bacterium]
MLTRTRKRKSTGSKRRFIGKPNGQIQQRVQDVGPEHFGVVAVDCAKRRSKWMLCNFYGKVIIEPTTVEHATGGLRAMTQVVAEVCHAEGLTDTIVAVENDADDWQAAIGYARHMTEIDPHGIGVWRRLGDVLWETGDRAGAADAYRRALANDANFELDELKQLPQRERDLLHERIDHARQ